MIHGPRTSISPTASPSRGSSSRRRRRSGSRHRRPRGRPWRDSRGASTRRCPPAGSRPRRGGSSRSSPSLGRCRRRSCPGTPRSASAAPRSPRASTARSDERSAGAEAATCRRSFQIVGTPRASVGRVSAMILMQRCALQEVLGHRRARCLQGTTCTPPPSRSRGTSARPAGSGRARRTRSSSRTSRRASAATSSGASRRRPSGCPWCPTCSTSQRRRARRGRATESRVRMPRAAPRSRGSPPAPSAAPLPRTMTVSTVESSLRTFASSGTSEVGRR